MTTRVQALRSSTRADLPAAGTRLPGELWTNFPDLQLGVIDASKNAQRLVAVRYFSTRRELRRWRLRHSSRRALRRQRRDHGGRVQRHAMDADRCGDRCRRTLSALAGGTLTGALTLNADPGAALGAATKQYVDGKVTAAPYLPLAGGTMTGHIFAFRTADRAASMPRPRLMSTAARSCRLPAAR